MLTLVLDMKTRDLIGFRLKGFKNFYLSRLKNKQDMLRSDFLLAASVLEQVAELAGELFIEDYNPEAYSSAWKMAAADNVELHDLPIAA